MCAGLEKTVLLPMSHQSLHRTYVMHLSFNLFSMRCPSHCGHPNVLPYLFFHQKLPPLASYSSAHPIEDLHSGEKLAYWFCSTIPQGLLYPGIFYTWSFHPSIFGSGTLGCPPDTRMSMTQS